MSSYCFEKTCCLGLSSLKSRPWVGNWVQVVYLGSDPRKHGEQVGKWDGRRESQQSVWTRGLSLWASGARPAGVLPETWGTLKCFFLLGIDHESQNEQFQFLNIPTLFFILNWKWVNRISSKLCKCPLHLAWDEAWEWSMKTNSRWT